MAARGRRAMSFSVDAVGIGKGDALPPSVQQPTAAFPVMEQKPLPLAAGEEAEYLLALKQEFRGAMRNLPGFVRAAAARRDVERYSDKYHGAEQTDNLPDRTPDWRRFPRELRVRVGKAQRDTGVSGKVQAEDEQKKKKKKGLKEKQDVLLKLETLEKKEEQAGSGDEDEAEGEEKKKKPEEEEVEAQEEYDEEFEEETDYIMSYFDNGEEFGGDSEDNMDEAVY